MLYILEKITVAHLESGFTHCSVNFSLEDRVSWCSHYSHVDGRIVDSSYHMRKKQPKYYLNEPRNINGPKTSSVLFLREISFCRYDLWNEQRRKTGLFGDQEHGLYSKIAWVDISHLPQPSCVIYYITYISYVCLYTYLHIYIHYVIYYIIYIYITVHTAVSTRSKCFINSSYWYCYYY